ncbi:MAG: ABC transporter substrate-binding protein [Deltaproteobacteria bacterium]|nr:ABC transporter substrate-binding protein [Candidatus Anaeroferrophillacea bacterium]
MQPLFSVILTIAALFSAACGPPETSPSRHRHPDEIRIALEGHPATLDPRFVTDAYGSRLLPLLYNGLVTIDNTGAVVPDLAYSWSSDSRQLAWHFRLRDDAVFADGSPCRALDVKATLDFLRDPGNGCPVAGGLEMIDNITVVSPLEIGITLREPHAGFLYGLAADIVPAGTRGTAADGTPPPGTGPFMLADYRRGADIVLRLNPHYHGRPPAVSRLVFCVIPNDTTRILALRKGSVDLVQNAVPPYALKFFGRNPDFAVVSRPGTGYKYIGYNLDDPVTGSRDVRRAISLAIDREQIITWTLKGQARPAAGILPREHWAADPDAIPDTCDPDAAERLLDDAGFPRRPPDGRRFALTFKTSTNQESYEIAEIIKKQLARVGIDMTIIRYEWGTFFQDIKNGNFQLYSLKWVGIQDPDIFHYIFHSESVPPRGANRGRYRRPIVDRLLDECRRTMDPDRRRELLLDLQRQLRDDAVYTSLWHRDDTAVIRRGLEGFTFFPGGAWTSLAEARWSPI